MILQKVCKMSSAVDVFLWKRNVIRTGLDAATNSSAKIPGWMIDFLALRIYLVMHQMGTIKICKNVCPDKPIHGRREAEIMQRPSRKYEEKIYSPEVTFKNCIVYL